MNLLSYDEIGRMYLIATVVMVGEVTGFCMAYIAYKSAVAELDKAIDEVKQALKVIDVK